MTPTDCSGQWERRSHAESESDFGPEAGVGVGVGVQVFRARVGVPQKIKDSASLVISES